MIGVNLLAYGWVNTVLAFVMSATGCLLAVTLTIKARGRGGRGRGRLLCYASIALGAIGIFQAQFLALLGFGIGATVPRYDWLTLLVSLGVAIVMAGAGLTMVSFGRPGTTRRVSAGILIGAGTAGTHYLAIYGTRAVGDLYYEPIGFVGSVAVGLLVGCAIPWFIVTARGMRGAVLAASIVGVGGCGMHYLAMLAVRTQPSAILAVDGSRPAAGFTPMLLMGPTILLGAAIVAMLGYFTVGTSTVYDLRAIFEDPEHSVEIEPWMIAEVTRRVTAGYHPPLASLATTGSSAANAAPVRTSQLDRYPPGYDRVRRNRDLPV